MHGHCLWTNVKSYSWVFEYERSFHNAGSHFNPNWSEHGGPTNDKGSRHAGDLGNIEAIGGTAMIDIEDKMISLLGKDSIIGRSMMVHAKEDDMSKDADPGARVACGVIGLAKGHNSDDVDGKWTTMDPGDINGGIGISTNGGDANDSHGGGGGGGGGDDIGGNGGPKRYSIE